MVAGYLQTESTMSCSFLSVTWLSSSWVLLVRLIRFCHWHNSKGAESAGQALSFGPSEFSNSWTLWKYRINSLKMLPRLLVLRTASYRLEKARILTQFLMTKEFPTLKVELKLNLRMYILNTLPVIFLFSKALIFMWVYRKPYELVLENWADQKQIGKGQFAALVGASGMPIVVSHLPALY